MSMSTSFLVAGGVGAVANYALFSQYTPVSMEWMLKELSAVIQPVAALKSVLPALLGFMGGTLLLLVWTYLKVRAVRFLLEYDGWFLHPKRPINKLWFLLMTLLLGKKNRGVGNYQNYLPSLPVSTLKKTGKKYLDSVRPLLTAEEYKETCAAVKEFVERDGKKLQWLLKFKSWKERNWIATWWEDFIYLRQRTPICFNSNYYATDSLTRPTTSQLDRAANVIHHYAKLHEEVTNGKLLNAMATKLVPFCSANYKFLSCTIRIPGQEKDQIVCYSKDKPTHFVVYRQGRYYQVEGISPVTGKPHSPLTIRAQLEKVMEMAGDTLDTTGVQNLTSLPRSRWAELHKELMKNPVNRRSFNIIASAVGLIVLETVAVHSKEEQAKLVFHGDGHSRWFDKSINLVLSSDAWLGANAEHTPLDATVCGQMWEYLLTSEQYDSDGKCLPAYPGETPQATPTPTQLKWEVEELKEDISDATMQLARMIQDSDLRMMTTKYGKAVPKRLKLSPDGWFQMAMQLAYYRLHRRFVLTYESATTRLYYRGRTETIRPVSDHSVTFVKAMDDTSASKDSIKELLKKAIEYQCEYKMEAMRGMGVDRHLFGLYVIAKGLKMDPMPKMFTDKAFNFSFLLSTSQTPVKATDRWRLETSTAVGGFGTVCDEGYGISYIVIGENKVSYSVHSKRSYPETSSENLCNAISQAFDDMRALFES